MNSTILRRVIPRRNIGISASAVRFLPSTFCPRPPSSILTGSQPPRPSYHAPCISSRSPCVRPVPPLAPSVSCTQVLTARPYNVQGWAPATTTPTWSRMRRARMPSSSTLPTRPSECVLLDRVVFFLGAPSGPLTLHLQGCSRPEAGHRKRQDQPHGYRQHPSVCHSWPWTADERESKAY